MLNDQKPERLLVGVSPVEIAKLDVINVWSTIQGEGPFAGVLSTFVRLAGCNLKCPLCDTQYTKGRRQFSIPDLVSQIALVQRPVPLYGRPIGVTKYSVNPLVVITGGEPFRQPNVFHLIEALLDGGFSVQVETNGTTAGDAKFLSKLHSEYGGAHKRRVTFTVVCSPKAVKVSDSLLPHIDYWKYVMECDQVHAEDGLPSSVLGSNFMPARPPLNTPPQDIYLQPVDVQDSQRNDLHLKAVVKSCMTFGYRLGVQLHKLIGVE